MTLIIVIQISIEETDKEKHSSSKNMKKNNEIEFLMMKNNKNNEYLKAVEIVNEKKNILYKHLLKIQLNDTNLKIQ